MTTSRLTPSHVLTRVRPMRQLALWAAACLLVACGGGSSSDPGALSGVAATGAPISGGTIDVACAAGTLQQATTSSAGTWTVSLSGQTLPCKVRVSGGNLATGVAYHAYAIDAGTVNVTPLTELLVAQLAGTAPATWFALRAPADFQKLTASAAATALDTVRKALSGETGLSLLGTFHPITGTFTATSTDPVDKLLEAFKTLFPNYGALVSAAQAPSFSATTAQAGKATVAAGGISAPLTAASTYTLAYTGTLCPGITCDVGLDVRSGVTGTFSSKGELTAYRYSAQEAPNLGTGSVFELGGNADLTWGRWASGQMAGTFYSLVFQFLPLYAGNGFHYVIGNQTPALPASGQATYSAIGATGLSYTSFGSSGKAGTIDLANSSAAVDFGSGKVAFDISYGPTATTTYRVSTPGGTGSVASSTFAFGNTFAPAKVAYGSGSPMLQTTVNGAPTPASFNVGTFAYLVPYGASAAYLALVFHDGGNGAGVVIFKKN